MAAAGTFTVSIPLGQRGEIEADLKLPERASGLIIFAHGSGSTRRSARNQAVANALVAHGFGTLLPNLLTKDEESVDAHTGSYRFDIALLAGRVATALAWAGERADLAALPIGLFGASTGAAAALVAAAEHPRRIAAVVSRGGRPDLAAAALPLVEAPTLLIVGADDHEVVRLNEQARERMHAATELRIIPGASHLFEEPGALEQVEQLAREWFVRYLGRAAVID
jgi:dienelactone hydrolase